MKPTQIPISGMITFDPSGDQPTFDVDAEKLAERLDGGEVEELTQAEFKRVHRQADEKIRELSGKLLAAEARLKEAEANRLLDAELVKRIDADGFAVALRERAEKAEARLKEAQAEERDYETLRGYFDAAQADAGRLRAALEKLLDAHARARKAEDAVDRDPENGDLDEFEDAFACLIICENEARELLTAEAVKSEAK